MNVVKSIGEITASEKKADSFCLLVKNSREKVTSFTLILTVLFNFQQIQYGGREWGVKESKVLVREIYQLS